MPARRTAGDSGGAGDTGERLGGYRAKRNFAKTPEPAPDPAPARGRAPARRASKRAPVEPRFVIHEHHATRLHWDLRLERDGALASWAIPKGMPPAPGENRFAAATEDHPLEYLDFHGEIPKGQYGAGRMTIWDTGTYECLKWELRKVEVALHGERLNARYALFPIDREDPPKDWMIHRMDPPEDADREPMPRTLAPMLARAGELPADDDGWAFEIKWDGVRALAFSEPGELRLVSRNGNEITERYPELGRLNRALSSHAAILDGEIVALGADGRPSFEALQRRMHLTAKAQVKRLAESAPVTYMIFDLLWLDGHPLVELGYEQRRELLAALDLAGERWLVPEHHVGDGQALLDASAEQGLEGVVAKRLDSTYQPGQRSSYWIKTKTSASQELVVGGWMPGKGKRAESVGALLLGYYDDAGALHYAGRVGSGFSDAELDRLAALLAPLRRDGSPFDAGPDPARSAQFVEPRLVAEVSFSEWTAVGSLRHPVYKGLRDDKDPRAVVRETGGAGGASGVKSKPAKAATARKTSATRKTPAKTKAPAKGKRRAAAPLLAGPRTEGVKSAHIEIEGHELALSNLDKLLYPEVPLAKADVIDHYAAIAPVLIPHLRERALTVIRWPDGVDGKSFFQKQATPHRPDWVRTVTLPAGSKAIDYLLADDLATVVWLANLAALELHVPLALAEHHQCPTAVVFDLDPGAPATIVECCEVALRLAALFTELGLESYPKTSGKKGLQVYVPLNRADVTFAQTKPFAKAVAEVLAGAEPELVVSNMAKAQRGGRVLIDWSQNDVNKTTVCAYSLRRTPRATVSTPVTWDEVSAARDRGDADSLTFEAHELLARMDEHGDLFAPVLSTVQRLPSF